VPVGGELHGAERRVGAGGVEDHGSRDGPEKSEVLEGHLGRPVGPDRDPDMRASKLDVQLRQPRDSDLIKCPREKGRESGAPRNPAPDREALRDADHILLGDEALHESLRKIVLEILRHCRVGGLRVTAHKAARLVAVA
jgi:hypothetical protein